jgi:osmotically-inducible protein OsmY
MAKSRGTPTTAALTSSPEIASGPLAEARRRFLTADYVELHRIECHVDDDVLTLRGIVPRYYLKQRAFHVVANLAGVRQISNDIHVECH